MSKPVNPDLAKERHSNLDLSALTSYIFKTRFTKPGELEYHVQLRDELVKKVKPIHEENFFNLSRDERYQMILKKSLELFEFSRENNIDINTLLAFAAGSVTGPERFMFGLHVSAFVVAIDMWGTEEQTTYWKKRLNENAIFGTYVQTEMGHGTFIRGLETTATYDKTTEEFIIHSPTLTSIKFWPGASGKTCSHAIVMANLVIDGVRHGIHGFIVQLRSLEDHTLLQGIETGDIGQKSGYDSTDNGYVKFNQHRIARLNMLMKYSVVTREGHFKRMGNEKLVYAGMMCLRAHLVLVATYLTSLSTTIAIRYSCVRRQFAGSDGIEPQIIEYKTQQYRLFPALATTYAYYFTSCRFNNNLVDTRDKTNNFENIDNKELNKIHALTAGLKAISFENALKFSQSNRLCCGGHGYSLASGIPQVIQEADAGSTYEGDNVVMLLQTARYLLKYTQTNTSPHLMLDDMLTVKSDSRFYQRFERLFDIHYKLYDEQMTEITSKMMANITERGLSHFEAWNEASVLLINAAKTYCNIYAMNCFMVAIYFHTVPANQESLIDLFELFLLFNFCDTYSLNILRLNVIDSTEMSQYNDRIGELLLRIRKNAVLLVDAFNWPDSVLCSALGAYDGQVYERLFEFAKASQFNKKEVHDAFEMYQKPYADKLRKHVSKL